MGKRREKVRGRKKEILQYNWGKFQISITTAIVGKKAMHKCEQEGERWAEI